MFKTCRAEKRSAFRRMFFIRRITPAAHPPYEDAGMGIIMQGDSSRSKGSKSTSWDCILAFLRYARSSRYCRPWCMKWPITGRRIWARLRLPMPIIRSGQEDGVIGADAIRHRPARWKENRPIDEPLHYPGWHVPGFMSKTGGERICHSVVG